MSDEENKRFSIDIIPYMFVGAGEEAYGRLLPLYLVVGPKSLQVSVANQAEECRCEVVESQDKLEHTFKKPMRTHGNLCVSLITFNLTIWVTCRNRCPSSQNWAQRS